MQNLRKLLRASIFPLRSKSLLPLCIIAAACLSTLAPPGTTAITAITLTQHTSKDAGTTTSSSLAFKGNNTAGNWIAICIRAGYSSSQVFTVKDSNGNAYRQAAQLGITAAAVTTAIYYAENIQGGPNTVTVSDTVSAPLRLAIMEYSGVATSNSLDVTAMGQGTGNLPSSGSSTTSSNGDLLLGAIATMNTAGFTAGSNYKIEESVPVEFNTKLIAEDRIQAAVGLASASASLLAADNWGAVLAAFKAAGTASGAVPGITSLNPASGTMGALVTITGTNFGATQGTSAVKFNGIAATPTSWSATSVVVPVPAGATTGNVVVTVGGAASNGMSFTVTVLTPSIASLSPASGLAGTPVTIAGGNFGPTQGTSTVTFNGIVAAPTSWSATNIIVPVPAGATTGNVVVTAGGMASNAVNFSVTLPAPSITTLNPASGLVGSSLAITGANFGASQGTSTLTVNGTAATSASWSDTSIVAPVPAGATTGNVMVTVGGAGSNGVLFTVTTPAPNITSLNPTMGVVGVSVVITGANLGASQGTSTVAFGGTAASPASWSSTSIMVLVPAGATTGNIVVTVGGVASNGVLFTVTAIPAPSISSLNPTSGVVGTSVTITGTNFAAIQGTSTVKFNGVAATPTSWSATSIVASAPTGATTGSVVVTVGAVASNGVAFTVTSAAAQTWTYVQDSITTYCIPPASSCPLSPGNMLATTAGSVWVLQIATANNVTISSVTGGGGAWVPCPNCHIYNATIGQNVDAWYNLSGPAGTSNIRVNLSGSSGAIFEANFQEFLPPPGASASYDDSGSTVALSCTTCTGVQLNNVTATDVILQVSQGASRKGWNAWSSPYITDNNGNGVSLNTTSGAAPTVNINGAGHSLFMAIAFKSSFGSFTSKTPQYSVVNFVAPTQTCSPSCLISVPATGSGHLLFVEAADLFNTHIVSISGGGTWVIPSGSNTCQISYVQAGNNAFSCGYLLSSAPGITSINVTMSGSVSTGFVFWEISTTNGSFAFDTQGSHQNAASFSPVGQPLTLSGSNDVIFQAAFVPGGSSSVTYYAMPHISHQGNMFLFNEASVAILLDSGASPPTPVWADEQNRPTIVSGVAFNSGAITASAATPSITSLNPTTGPVATSVTIAGTNFGASQGTSTVTFNGTATTPTSWSATSIVAPVPTGATTGNVVVTVGGVASNGVNFTVTTGTAVWPIKVSTNGRYFTDASGAPWLMVGDSTHHIVNVLVQSSWPTYFASRQAQGFNTVNIMSCSHGNCPTTGATADGQLPFTGSIMSVCSGASRTDYDLATPNPAYWTELDNFINMAASYGLLVLFDPLTTADYMPDMRASGSTKVLNFGAFLGNRYKNFPNIIWELGNDFQTWTQTGVTCPGTVSDNTLVQQLMAGIASADTNHIQTIQLDYYRSYSNQDSALDPYLKADGFYTYYETYDYALKAYNSSPVSPVFLTEANMEGANNTNLLTSPANALILRRQMYWTMTSGAAGHVWGNTHVNHSDLIAPTWQSQLNTPATAEVALLTKLFNQFQWWTLVPDQTHQVVTAGFGTVSPNNENLYNSTYATTAWNPNGSLAVVYAPIATTLTVNMANFSKSMAASWYDPTTGTSTAISGSPFTNSGSQSFTTPSAAHSDGTNDWVLVLQ